MSRVDIEEAEIVRRGIDQTHDKGRRRHITRVDDRALVGMRSDAAEQVRAAGVLLHFRPRNQARLHVGCPIHAHRAADAHQRFVAAFVTGELEPLSAFAVS